MAIHFLGIAQKHGELHTSQLGTFSDMGNQSVETRCQTKKETSPTFQSTVQA